MPNYDDGACTPYYPPMFFDRTVPARQSAIPEFVTVPDGPTLAELEARIKVLEDEAMDRRVEQRMRAMGLEVVTSEVSGSYPPRFNLEFINTGKLL